MLTYTTLEPHIKLLGAGIAALRSVLIGIWRSKPSNRSSFGSSLINPSTTIVQIAVEEKLKVIMLQVLIGDEHAMA